MHERLHERFGERLRARELMSEHTTLAVGGPADCFLSVETEEELGWLSRFLHETCLPVQWIGGGSNLLVGDLGISGLVARLDLRGIEVVEADRVRVGAGERLSAFVRWSVDAGWSGFDVLAGIPGHVGGAVAGNAGAYGKAISDHCLRVRVCRRGEFLWLDRHEIDFAYRGSSLRDGGDVISSIEFALVPGDAGQLRASVKEIVAARARKVPPRSVPCAGSWFKNLPPLEEGAHRRAAGWFLDRCGMKGQSVGAAEVWPDHANIIVNRGGASAQDVANLADRMRRAVEERFGIRLEAEVRSLGRFSAL